MDYAALIAKERSLHVWQVADTPALRSAEAAMLSMVRNRMGAWARRTRRCCTRGTTAPRASGGADSMGPPGMESPKGELRDPSGTIHLDRAQTKAPTSALWTLLILAMATIAVGDEPDGPRLAVADSLPEAAIPATLLRLGWQHDEEDGGWEHRNFLVFRNAWVSPELRREIVPGVLRRPSGNPALQALEASYDPRRRLSFPSRDGMSRPALEWFLEHAVVQEAFPDSLTEESLWLPRSETRSGAALLGKLLVSSRWAMDHVESGTPLALDAGPATTVAHATGWMADVFGWGMVLLAASMPGMETGERIQAAAFTFGVGAAGRILVAGIPLGSALGFRNAMMTGPYRWPARDHRGRPWPLD